MSALLSLPDELRLHIFECIFCEISIKFRASQQQHQRTTTRRRAKLQQEEDAPPPSSPAFAIFLVSRAFAADPILHKALRTAATISLSSIEEIEQLYTTLDPAQHNDLRHFSIQWKRKSVCPKGRMGIAIDVLINKLKTKFPGTSTFSLTTNPFEMCLWHPTVPDMAFISEYAVNNGLSTRYMDDCGNQRAVDLIVYDEFHCCTECLRHHVNAVNTGVEINFQFNMRPGYSFGRPGMSDGPYKAMMSTEQYILEINDGKIVHGIPQRTFEDIQELPPVREGDVDFRYSCENVNGIPTRLLKTKDGVIVRKYPEDKVWRAG